MKAILILTLMWSTFSFSKPKKDCEAGEVKLPKHNMFQSMEKMTEVVANDPVDFQISDKTIAEFCTQLARSSTDVETRNKTEKMFLEMFGISDIQRFHELRIKDKERIQNLWSQNNKRFMCEGDDFNYETGDPLEVYLVTFALEQRNTNFLGIISETLELNFNNWNYDNLVEGNVTALDALDAYYNRIAQTPKTMEEYKTLRAFFIKAGAKKCEEIPECTNP
jgi:hypothetical protein